MANLQVLQIEARQAKEAAISLYFELLRFTDNAVKYPGLFPAFRELIMKSVSVNSHIGRVLDEIENQREEERQKYE